MEVWKKQNFDTFSDYRSRWGCLVAYSEATLKTRAISPRLLKALFWETVTPFFLNQLVYNFNKFSQYFNG